MIALRTSGLAATLLLSAVACALAGPVAPTTSAPVVKIGDAWAQERITLPDGTVHTQTYSNGAPVEQSAKTVALQPTPHKTAKA